MLLGAGVAVVARLLTHAAPADGRLAPRAAVERARAPQRGPGGGEASVGRGLRERPRTARPRRRRAAPASANDASAATRLQPVDGSHDGAGISAPRVERPEFSFER